MSEDVGSIQYLSVGDKLQYSDLVDEFKDPFSAVSQKEAHIAGIWDSGSDVGEYLFNYPSKDIGCYVAIDFIEDEYPYYSISVVEKYYVGPSKWNDLEVAGLNFLRMMNSRVISQRHEDLYMQKHGFKEYTLTFRGKNNESDRNRILRHLDTMFSE